VDRAIITILALSTLILALKVVSSHFVHQTDGAFDNEDL
jgi:hypothetical protein